MTPDSQDAALLLSALAGSEGYCELEMWEQAWNVLEDLPDHLRVTAEALHGRVMVLVGSREAAKAMILAESVVSTFPQRADAWFGLACAQAIAGQIEQAKTAVMKCVELDLRWRTKVLQAPALEGIW